MTKRIALLFPTLEYGGVFRVMTNLAHGLHQQGYAIDILTARGNDAYIAVHAAPDFCFLTFHVRHMIAGFPQLVRYLRNQRPAVLISAQTHTNLIAVLACRLTSRHIRSIVTEHSHPPSIRAHAATQKEKWTMSLTKIFYRHADAVVGVSTGVTEGLVELLGWSDKSIHTIYNPLVSDSMLQQAEEPLTHPWFQAGQPPVILSVGRLVREKDYSSLLSAFDALRRTTDARLMILGEGEKREALEKQINVLGLANSVLLPGFVDSPLPYMKHAAVFVLSSIWEGFPGVLVEALACGAPIVSTRCPSGPGEILQDGEWGELVPVGDTEALARAMLKKLDTGSVPGQTTYARRFSIQNAAQQYLALIKTLEES